MQAVPVQAVPSQTIGASLGGQQVTLNLYQKSTGLFMDVLVAGVPIVVGVICLNLNRIVRSVYLGFIGDFAFYDTQGSSDPVSTGLGTRYGLIYLEAVDVLNLSPQA